MSNEKSRAVLYVREVKTPESDPEPFLYLQGKWDGFDDALDSDANVIVVAFLEVLGDNYTELIINLGKLAASAKL